ncbi:DUF6090 family protein [Lutimonas halocynthiae]|uniref:DUF6090 family protein n=1 Tax=Lutimonas halocynthiae TaxID=1446477 RepID=UPI0025B4A5FA|nr:DUF6090 family protein [Lutimonas halocynthiae]MDN3642907.1 DUF6090 family protein [Lutimonas halocynthiae]
MADDNRPLKYARYAVGEIILVVIGILIALQINTWNEERKTGIIETKTLKEIRSNLMFDLVELDSDIDIMDSITISGEAVIDYLSKYDQPNDEFKYNVQVSRINPHFDPMHGGFSLLNSKGLDIISNDSLRGSISKLYESSYPYYAKYENERIFKINNIILPKYAEYFSFISNQNNYFEATSEISQTDYIALKNDPSFINILNLAILENNMVQNRAQRTSGNINDLIDFIDEELRD